MKLKKFIFALCLSPSVYSVPGDWTPAGLITSIIIEHGNAVIVINDEIQGNFIPAECQSKYYVISLDDDHGKATLSVALASKASGKKVMLKSKFCYNSYRPELLSIQQS